MWGKVCCLRKQHDGRDWVLNNQASDLKSNALTINIEKTHLHWTQPSVECYAAAFVIVTEDYSILWEMLELAEVVVFAAGAAAAAVAVAFFLPLEAVLLTEDCGNNHARVHFCRSK